VWFDSKADDLLFYAEADLCYADDANDQAVLFFVCWISALSSFVFSASHVYSYYWQALNYSFTYASSASLARRAS